MHLILFHLPEPHTIVFDLSNTKIGCTMAPESRELKVRCQSELKASRIPCIKHNPSLDAPLSLQCDVLHKRFMYCDILTVFFRRSGRFS